MASAASQDLPDEAFERALAASDDPRARELSGDPGVAAALREAASVEGALAGCGRHRRHEPERVQAALEEAKRRLAAG